MNGQMKKEKRGKLPEILSEQEQKALLSQPNPKAPTGLRNLCVMLLMLNAGLRLSEVTGLKTTEINLDSGEITVRKGRNDTERTLWIGDKDLQVLRQWKEIKPGSDYFFCTLKGEPLSDRYIREMVKRLSRKAGIEKNVFPHSLRHTFAADLYKKTRDIRIVQKALGHANLSSTMIYTYIINDELEEAMNSFVRERQLKLFQEKDTGRVKEKEKEKEKENEKEKEKEPRRAFLIHAIKCRCGDILGQHMEHCPSCGECIDSLLERLKNDFHRVNFGDNVNN